MLGKTFGILLIVLGIALLLGELLGSSATLFLFWPVAVLLWGVRKLQDKEIPFGTGLIVVGSVLLVDSLLPSQLNENLSTFWPLLLVALGVLIILSSFETSLKEEVVKPHGERDDACP